MGEIIPFVPRNSTDRRPMLSPSPVPSVLDYTELCETIDAHNERIAGRLAGPLEMAGFIAPEQDPA